MQYLFYFIFFIFITQIPDLYESVILIHQDNLVQQSVIILAK